MAIDGTYSGLKTSVADFLNRSDLTSVVPDFVALAEAQINRRLMRDGPVRQMMGRSDATVNAEFIAVPSDFLGAKAIYLSPNYQPVEIVSPEEIVRRKTLYPNETGDPKVFAVVGGQLQFWPWVSTGSFSGELTYWKSIPALTSTNTTNWLLTAYPDIYLYTSLIQSAPYLRDDARLQVWVSISEAALSDFTEADKKARTAPYQGVGIVPGGTP
jgi:hypothetical protein